MKASAGEVGSAVAETAKYGASSARAGAAVVGAKVYAGGAVAGTAVKSKLDETGVSDVAKKGYDSVVTNAKYAGGIVNEKIDANPTLARAKTSTAAGLAAAGSYMSSMIWGA